MRRIRSRSLKLWTFGAALGALLVLSLACAGKATPTPAPKATTAPAPTVTATPVPRQVGAPTPTAAPAPTAVAKGLPVYGGTLRFAHALHIDTLDPIFNTLGGSYQVFFGVYNELFKIDQAANVLPSLAKSWDFSADGKTITLQLQTGVKFHDGTDFNAQAVKWNFDRMLDPNQSSPRRGELQPYLERIEVLDTNTLKLHLYNPFRPLLPILASDRPGFLVSPAAVSKYGGGRDGNYNRNPVGTGPFRFVEWVLQERLVLKRNDGYWEPGKPYLDAILMQGVPDPSVRIAMLRTGETDIIYFADVKGGDIPIIGRNPELRLIRLDGISTYMLQFNTSKPPFNNKALRQAIAYAIDRDKFVIGALGGVGAPLYSPTPSGWAYNQDLKPIVFDLAKAKQKLVEAGYPSGATIPMGCPTTGVYFDMCEVTQAMAKEAGINLEIKLLQFANYFSRTEAGYFLTPGFGATQTVFRLDPHPLLHAYYHTKGRNNPDGYNNPEFDRLVDEAATIYDTTKAKALYDRLQTIVVEDAPSVILARGTALFPMSKRVQGFVPYPTGFEHLEFTWLEK